MNSEPKENAPFVEDHALEHWVHWTLTFGLVLSAVLLSAGLLLSIRQGTAQASHAPRRFFKLLAGLKHGDGIAVLGWGLLVLTMTPIVRVGVLSLGWFARRDWRFATVSLVVLSLLIVGMFLGMS